MKIMIFTEGTILTHKSGEGLNREEIVEQSRLEGIQREEASINYESKYDIPIELYSPHDYKNYIPNGDVNNLVFRKQGESYVDVVERNVPDILIEDNCESIGGEKEMTYTQLSDDFKRKIKSIAVKEFAGIDDLPDNLTELETY